MIMTLAEFATSLYNTFFRRCQFCLFRSCWQLTEIPDRPFRNFRASISADWRILYSSGAPDFEAPKLWKGRSGRHAKVKHGYLRVGTTVEEKLKRMASAAAATPVLLLEKRFFSLYISGSVITFCLCQLFIRLRARQNLFPVLELHHQEIAEFYVVPERRATDFWSSKIVKGSVGRYSAPPDFSQF